MLKKKKKRNLKKFNPSEMLKQKASRKCVYLHDKKEEFGIWIEDLLMADKNHFVLQRLTSFI